MARKPVGKKPDRGKEKPPGKDLYLFQNENHIQGEALIAIEAESWDDANKKFDKEFSMLEVIRSTWKPYKVLIKIGQGSWRKDI